MPRKDSAKVEDAIDRLTAEAQHTPQNDVDRADDRLADLIAELQNLSQEERVRVLAGAMDKR